MSEDNPPLNYGQLVDALQNLCQQRKSGTMLVATHDNNLARILLDGGRIVSIVFGQKRDSDAIALVREIRSCRVKFSEGVVGMHEGANLPATGTILRMLGGRTNAPGGAGTTTIEASAAVFMDDVPPQKYVSMRTWIFLATKTTKATLTVAHGIDTIAVLFRPRSRRISSRFARRPQQKRFVFLKRLEELKKGTAD